MAVRFLGIYGWDRFLEWELPAANARREGSYWNGTCLSGYPT
jgi:hypothetical protein